MKTSQRKGRENEKKKVRLYGGRRTPGSGNKWGFKGDIKGDVFLFEDKHTDRKSFSITEKLWNKAKKEALLESRRPAFRVTFASGTSFIVLDEPDFYEIMDKVKEVSK